MLEIALLIVASIGMAKMAESDDQSPVIWGFVTFGLGFAAIQFIPLPFLRVLIAPVAAFILMMVYKTVSQK